MRLRKRLLAAGLLAGLPIFGVGASPAAANQVRRDITFTFSGEEVTCTVEGSGNVVFFEDSDTFGISGRTALVDDDPACHEAIREIYVSASYRRDPDDDPTHVSSASAASDNVGLDVLVRGALSSLVIQNTAVFLCDNEPTSSTCPITFTTYSK